MSNTTYKTYSYDIEVFKNCFTFTAIEVNDINDKKEFVMFYDMFGNNHRNDMKELNIFINTPQYLLGYNSSKYDDIILKYILSMTYKFKTLKETLLKIKEFSDLVVSQQKFNTIDNYVIAISKYKTQFIGIDFMKTMALDKSLKSLKQTLINVKYHNIQDYDMPPITELEYKTLYKDLYSINVKTMPVWDRYVLVEMLPDLLSYNNNDTDGLRYLFNKYINEFKLRYSIQVKHGFFALSSSKSNLADRLMNIDYAKLTGLSYDEFKDLRTHRNAIKLSTVISDKVIFKTKELKELYKKVYDTVVTVDTGFSFSVIFNKKEFTMALGGLHSVDIPGVYEAIDYSLRDADVTSFYPTLMLNLGIAPIHLNKTLFLAMLKGYVTTRVTAKREGDMITSDILKIVINSIYGKLGFIFSWLFDRKAMLEVTINGQFALFMLIEQLAEIGIKTISANTDGIVCIVPPVKEKDYYLVCNNWSKHWELDLEYTDYIKFIQRDVNAYLTVKRIPYDSNNKKHLKFKVFEDDKGKYIKDIKRKGSLNKNRATDDLAKAFVTPIIPIAIEEYFVNGTPIEYTIKNHNDIYDFCMSQNAGGKFRFEIHKVIDSVQSITELQKNLRFYISSNGGTLYKRSVIERGGNNSITSVVAGNKVTEFNKYIAKEMSDYNINYTYYLKEADKLVNIIKYSLNTKKKSRKAYSNYITDNGLFKDLI